MPVEECRYTVGAFLAYDADASDREKIFAEFRSHGYDIKEMNDTGKAVYCTFPHTTDLSIILGLARVYPQMSEYILVSKIMKTAFLKTSHYIHPLFLF